MQVRLAKTRHVTQFPRGARCEAITGRGSRCTHEATSMALWPGAPKSRAVCELHWHRRPRRGWW